MKTITDNEMLFVSSIFKSPEADYNANSIAKQIGISSMGALKIARKLEKDHVLVSKKLGKATFYKLNYSNDYARQYIKFLLKREAEQSTSYVRMWINEIKKIKSADAAILFGSVLKKEKNAQDIDVLFITDKKKFKKMKKEIEEISSINVKKIHPLFQTRDDLKANIEKKDGPLLEAIRGVVVFGEDFIINLLAK